jgi:hypothetical protein
MGTRTFKFNLLKENITYLMTWYISLLTLVYHMVMHCIKENNGFRMESYNSRPFQKSFLNQRNKIIAFLLLPSEKAQLFHILKK